MKVLIVLFGIVLGISVMSFFYVGKFRASYKKAVVEIGTKRFSVDVAETMGARAKGLSGREKLDKDEGIFFIFGNPGKYGFWMKDMKFPIDIIWIKENKIVGFEENISPQIGVSEFNLKLYYPPEPIKYVLEVKAGTVSEIGFKIGDEIRYNEINGKDSN